MFGKIFVSIYNGTLMSEHGWLGVYIFASMIVLADKDGIVDMDERSIYRTLGFADDAPDPIVDFETFVSILGKLCEPDPFSNIKKMDGKRLIALRDLDDIPNNRGYFVVNYDDYRRRGSTEERNEYARGYMAAMRKMSRNINTVSIVKDTLVDVSKIRHTDSDTDTSISNASVLSNSSGVSKSENKEQSVKKPKSGGSAPLPPGFVSFWEKYPKRIGKGAALRSWVRIKPDKTLQDKILAAIESQKQGEAWLKDNGQFIPHPATWLNQQRWDDEPTKPLTKKPWTWAGEQQTTEEFEND